MISDCKKLVDILTESIRDLVDVAVVGMSGGADSTLVTILCMKALGKNNVYGISMPYNETDRRTFNTASEQVAEKLGINHLVCPVNEIADAINRQVEVSSDCALTDINTGNSRSRARMCVLYGIAHNLSARFSNKRVRVMGTGNLSEDFIGYDTKGGDALADIFPIGELLKSEVYQLLEHFRDLGVIEEKHINRVPSAGLAEGQTDEGDLGYSYNDMEPAVLSCMKKKASGESPGKDPDPITSFVWERHCANRHKHEAPIVIKLRSYCS